MISVLFPEIESKKMTSKRQQIKLRTTLSFQLSSKQETTSPQITKHLLRQSLLSLIMIASQFLQKTLNYNTKPQESIKQPLRSNNPRLESNQLPKVARRTPNGDRRASSLELPCVSPEEAGKATIDLLVWNRLMTEKNVLSVSENSMNWQLNVISHNVRGNLERKVSEFDIVLSISNSKSSMISFIVISIMCEYTC